MYYSQPAPCLDMYRFSLCFPVSITYLTPGIVMEVSAILVARIHFRLSGGAIENIFDCWPGAKDAYKGQTNTCKVILATNGRGKNEIWRTPRWSGGNFAAYNFMDSDRLSISSCPVKYISKLCVALATVLGGSPGRNISTSPAGSSV